MHSWEKKRKEKERKEKKRKEKATVPTSKKMRGKLDVFIGYFSCKKLAISNDCRSHGVDVVVTDDDSTLK